MAQTGLFKEKVTLRRRRGNVTADLRKGIKGELIVQTKNDELMSIGIAEFLIMGCLIAMMICFR